MAKRNFNGSQINQSVTIAELGAVTLDDVIEAVESSEYKQILGVQWHPEWLEEEGLKIFQFIAVKWRKHELYISSGMFGRDTLLRLDE